MATKEVKNFRLQVDVRCHCKGCVRKIKKAMASVDNFNGIKTSVVDINRGIITVVGHVNPIELSNWLKNKINKDVKIVYPDPPVENPKKKMTLVVENNTSETQYPTPTAPPLPDQMFRALMASEVESDRDYLRLIEERIRDLEKARDLQKIKNLENELAAVKHELEQCKRVIDRNKKALLDGALNQLYAYQKLQAHTVRLRDSQ